MLPQQSRDRAEIDSSGVSEDHREFGEGASDLVEPGRPREAVTAGKDPDVTRMVQDGEPVLLHGLVDRPEQRIVDRDLLHGPVQLQPARTALLYLGTEVAHGVVRPGIDRAESDQPVGCQRHLFGHVMVDAVELVRPHVAAVGERHGHSRTDAVLVHRLEKACGTGIDTTARTAPVRVGAQEHGNALTGPHVGVHIDAHQIPPSFRYPKAASAAASSGKPAAYSSVGMFACHASMARRMERTPAAGPSG